MIDRGVSAWYADYVGILWGPLLISHRGALARYTNFVGVLLGLRLISHRGVWAWSSHFCRYPFGTSFDATNRTHRLGLLILWVFHRDVV
jgi:hypothetical protein